MKEREQARIGYNGFGADTCYLLQHLIHFIPIHSDVTDFNEQRVLVQ